MELINRLAAAVKTCETITAQKPQIEIAWNGGLCSDIINHPATKLRMTMQVYAGTQTYICDTCLTARHGFNGWKRA